MLEGGAMGRAIVPSGASTAPTKPMNSAMVAIAIWAKASARR